jgi:2-hydroxychromene-2-carboxylate isomerase
MRAPARARFYFSFRSPYAWLASRMLAGRLAEEERAALEYVPFWEPDPVTLDLLRGRDAAFLYRPMSRERHLYILQDVKRLARHFGYAMQWPVDPASPWWERPHLAYVAARRVGRAEACFEALYRRRWEQGQDICAEGTLVEVAAEIGVAPDLLLGAPDDPASRAAGVDALEAAYRDSVFGVPFFVLGADRFWGSDRLEFFLDALARRGVHARSAGPSPFYRAPSPDGAP